MTQELRGLGNSSTRARNTLNLSLKPKAAIATLQGGFGGTRKGPVKVQNFVDTEITNSHKIAGDLDNTEAINEEAKQVEEEAKGPPAQQPPARSFSPVVFVKRYLNIAI